jgi:hypothetical protein
MKRLLISLLLLVAALAHGGDSVSALGRESRALFDAFAKVRPGMTVEQVRARYPDLTDPIQSVDSFARTCMMSESPNVRIAGEEWSIQFFFSDGKLYGARFATISHEDREKRISRADARILKRTVMRHFANQHGAQPEMYVPLLECPAGNPYSLRKSWSWRTHILAVDFDGYANSGTVSVQIWAPKDWNEENKKFLEDLWPLKPA